jgi:hypothetical protein
MKMKVISRMKVPLKVNNVMNNKNWLKYLRKNGLKKKFENGYNYWQEIVIISLEKK